MKQSLGAKILAMPTPAWVVGTYDDQGRPNIMTAAWAGVCCSEPPCVQIALRKATYTYGALFARRAFTISVLPASRVAEVDYVGTASGRDTDKFKDCGFTAVRAEKVDAPFVNEAPLIYECRLAHTLELGLHTLFVGEILDVKADPAVVGERGHPDVGKIDPLVWEASQRGYFRFGAPVGQAWKTGKSIAKKS